MTFLKAIFLAKNNSTNRIGIDCNITITVLQHLRTSIYIQI